MLLDGSVKVVATGSVTNTPMTDINVVLDRSGSMASIWGDTIGGFNTFLEQQAALPDPAIISLYQFDNEYQIDYEHKPIREAPKLTRVTYVPRGSTALLDAIGRTVQAVTARDSKKIVIVIITDGHENSSREFDSAQIKALTKEKEALGWQFVYLGANQDAFDVGQGLGISGVNTMSVAANAAGTQSMYSSISKNLADFRSGSKVDMSFTNEDKQKQEQAGAPKSGLK